MSRISYRNCVGLDIFRNGASDKLRVCPADFKGKDQAAYFRVLKLQIDDFSGRTPSAVLKISNSFVEATSKAMGQLVKFLPTWVEDIDVRIVTSSRVLALELTHFNGGVFTSFMATSVQGDFVVSVTGNTYSNGTHELQVIRSGMFDEDAQEPNDRRSMIRAMEMVLQVQCLLLFRKYAQVETVESKARTKIHAHGCKYLNETDLDIEYLDSKWFTTLVNSTAFKVGGHFRLQPKKKDGEWTKELIWIDDFEKKGYNRKAKILE